jgi:hypothetical protein
MEKRISNEQLKNVGYVLGYWIILVIAPFLLALLIKSNDRHSNTPGWIALYCILIAPLLYFIPYLLARPKSKFLFIFWGLALPYLFIYTYMYLDFRAHFGISLM